MLYCTDLHARGNNPRARMDDYQEAMRRKLIEIDEISCQHQCQAVLFGGDLTHSPDAAPSVINALIRSLRRFSVPIYGIAGNTHDVWGDNVSTLPRTALGVVEAAGLIKLLWPGDALMLEEEDGFKVQITGQHYHAEIDRRYRAFDYCVAPSEATGWDEWKHWRRPDARWAIHMVHGMLRTRPLHHSVPVTLVADVLSETSADITLSGHDHGGYGIVRQGNKIACNPGAIMRGTAAREEIARTVQVALIELTADSCDVQLIPLQSAAPGPDVLDRSHIDQAIEREQALEEFIEAVRKGGHFEALDVVGVIQRIADNQGVSPEVRAEALARVEAAQEAIGAGAAEEVA